MQGLPAQTPETPVLNSLVIFYFFLAKIPFLQLPKASFRKLSNTAYMANSWKEAKECAKRENLPQVFHDCDDNIFGACNQGEIQGCFKAGMFIEHRSICMPAHLSTEELEEKERKFHQENPDW